MRLSPKSSSEPHQKPVFVGVVSALGAFSAAMMGTTSLTRLVIVTFLSAKLGCINLNALKLPTLDCHDIHLMRLSFQVLDHSKTIFMLKFRQSPSRPKSAISKWNFLLKTDAAKFQVLGKVTISFLSNKKRLSENGRIISLSRSNQFCKRTHKV